MTDITQLAQHLADRVRDDKQPYRSLNWIVENCDWQYRASKSDLRLAQFAAVNILKRDGVETSTIKRKPLTTLSKVDRAKMRGWAKEFAQIMTRLSGIPIEVTRKPIQDYEDGSRIQVAIKFHRSGSLFFYPTFEQLQEWSQFDSATKITQVYKFVERFKSSDQRIAENLETIKSKLDCLIED